MAGEKIENSKLQLSSAEIKQMKNLIVFDAKKDERSLRNKVEDVDVDPRKDFLDFSNRWGGFMQEIQSSGNAGDMLSKLSVFFDEYQSKVADVLNNTQVAEKIKTDIRKEVDAIGNFTQLKILIAEFKPNIQLATKQKDSINAFSKKYIDNPTSITQKEIKDAQSSRSLLQDVSKSLMTALSKKNEGMSVVTKNFLAGLYKDPSVLLSSMTPEIINIIEPKEAIEKLQGFRKAFEDKKDLHIWGLKDQLKLYDDVYSSKGGIAMFSNGGWELQVSTAKGLQGLDALYQAKLGSFLELIQKFEYKNISLSNENLATEYRTAILPAISFLKSKLTLGSGKYVDFFKKKTPEEIVKTLAPNAYAKMNTVTVTTPTPPKPETKVVETKPTTTSQPQEKQKGTKEELNDPFAKELKQLATERDTLQQKIKKHEIDISDAYEQINALKSRVTNTLKSYTGDKKKYTALIDPLRGLSMLGSLEGLQGNSELEKQLKLGEEIKTYFKDLEKFKNEFKGKSFQDIKNNSMHFIEKCNSFKARAIDLKTKISTQKDFFAPMEDLFSFSSILAYIGTEAKKFMNDLLNLNTTAKDIVLGGVEKYLGVMLDDKKTLGQTINFGYEYSSVKTDGSKTAISQDPLKIAKEITDKPLLQAALSAAFSQVLFDEKYTRKQFQTFVTKDYSQNLRTITRGDKSIQIKSGFTVETGALSPTGGLSNVGNIAGIIPGGSEVYSIYEMLKSGKERGANELKSFSVYTGVTYKQALGDKTALELTGLSRASVDASLYLGKEFLAGSNIFNVLPASVRDLAEPYLEQVATGKLSFALASPVQVGGEGKVSLHFFPTKQIDTWIGVHGKYMNGKVFDSTAFGIGAGMKIRLGGKSKSTTKE